MTPTAFADLLGARPAGRGRWQALCPAHPDHSPSLQITESCDGRVLLKCWAGCSIASILAALSLRMRDLFAGPPPKPEAIRQAVREREAEDALEQEYGALERRLSDVVRRMTFVVPVLAERLVYNSGCDLTAALLAEALALGRVAEAGLRPT